jgi:predicted DNA-binding transcriptional regulator YafY
MTDRKRASTKTHKQTRKGPHRKPTYPAATRLARIALELQSRPFGWGLEAIQDELRIAPRTLARYLAVCRHELVDLDGRPMIEVVKRGGRRLLRLAESTRSAEPTVYQAVVLYFTLSMIASLEGTVLKEGVEDLWDRLSAALSPAQRPRLANVARKFYAVPYLQKDYRAFDDKLDLIVRCLVDQHRMRIDYKGVGKRATTHEFDAYTLALYRGGLYLLGLSHLHGQIIWLAVERIGIVRKLPERFEYPRDYTPEKHTEGTFGIIAGPETEVRLLIRNPETMTLLASRRLHPTQRFRRRRDGTTLLEMKVRGTTELASWVLSLAPWVEVLAPAELRDEVAGRLSEAAQIYARKATA